MSGIDRRSFCSLFAAVPATAAVSGIMQQPTKSELETEEPSQNGFPAGDYTPFGYLDNPWHTWDLSPSGVLRSLPGIGFGWYYPAGPGGYFSYQQNNVYVLELSLGFEIGSRRFRSARDFAAGQLSSPHHTKNLLSYQFVENEIAITSTFVLANENALACAVNLENASAKRQSIRVLAVQSYRLGAANWWGRDGLAGNFNQKTNSLEIRSFAAGPVCATIVSGRPSASFVSSHERDIEGWFEAVNGPSQATSYYPEPLHGGLRYELTLEANSRQQLVVAMTRGANTQIAGESGRLSLGNAVVEIARKRAEDEAFWKAAPQLTGDWPPCWRHGWVYDFETLRMMVRQPRGVYKHAWDAMQIQAPRNVLAETSIDMWALSYAAPEMSKAVFLGQFQDALADNIPCMREDGVMNMVAADGSECGTAISWCYPFFCAASIFDRTQDLPWLRALYPGLARLLRWTIANRVDAGGFLVGKCSWETGMDASKRFLINQPTGGELTEFVRLSELQAAAAQAGEILARFAKLVGDGASIAEWKQVQATFAARTQALWKEGWFRDFDSRTGRLVTETDPDPAQSAALFCGVATADQKREALLTLHKLYDASRARGKQPAQGWDDGLAWSSLVLPYLESVWAAGDYALAVNVVTTIADRIYTSMDRRSVAGQDSKSKQPAIGWPGVSCEIWGAHGAFGGEGYGWGAVMPAHIIRSLIGIRESSDPKRISICPNLPDAFLSAGKVYGLRGLPYGSTRLSLQYEILDTRRIRVTGDWENGLPISSITDAEGRSVEFQIDNRKWQFAAQSRKVYTVAS